ncbi:glyoxalase, partial [Klebsiella pneumoniae]
MKVLNILIRRCVLIARFEDTVSFYENLIAQKARLRFDYPEYDLKLAQVGSVLLI